MSTDCFQGILYSPRDPEMAQTLYSWSSNGGLCIYIGVCVGVCVCVCVRTLDFFPCHRLILSQIVTECPHVRHHALSWGRSVESLSHCADYAFTYIVPFVCFQASGMWAVSVTALPSSWNGKAPKQDYCLRWVSPNKTWWESGILDHTDRGIS